LFKNIISSFSFILIFSGAAFADTQPVELLRDIKFESGFRFKLPDNSEEYEESGQITTNEGLSAYTLNDSGNTNMKPLVGINNIGGDYVVPPWKVGGFQYISTPYDSYYDRDSNGNFIGGVSNCPSNGSGVFPCVWTGKSAAGGDVLIEVSAGRNQADYDFSLKFNTKKHHHESINQNYWGLCSYPTIASYPHEGDAEVINLQGAEPVWVGSSVCDPGPKDESDPDADFFNQANLNNIGPQELFGQDWPHADLIQKISGHNSLKDISKLRFEGSMRVIRTDEVANQDFTCKLIWDDAAQLWKTENAHGEPCARKAIATKDLGVMITDITTGNSLWVSIVKAHSANHAMKSYGFQGDCEFFADLGQIGTADVLICENGLTNESGGSGRLNRVPASPWCVLNPADGKSLGDSPNEGYMTALTDPVSGARWECQTSDDDFSSSFFSIPSYISMTGNTHHRPDLNSLNPMRKNTSVKFENHAEGSVVLWVDHALGIGDQVQFFGNTPAEIALHEPYYVWKVVDKDRFLIADQRMGDAANISQLTDFSQNTSLKLNIDLTHYAGNNFTAASYVGPVDTGWVDIAINLYDLELSEDWLREAVGAIHSSHSDRFTNLVDNYAITEFAVSFEFGWGMVDEELQVKNLSLSATYKDGVLKQDALHDDIQNIVNMGMGI